MIIILIGAMGAFKTSTATIFARAYSEKNAASKIYANFHLLLPNSIFTPFMFLPYSQLDKCLIIADDFYALKNVEGFIAVIVNMSRKLSIDAILTCQYYTMIPKQLRELSTVIISPKYFPDLKTLKLNCDFKDFQSIMLIEDPISLCKDYYDTTEIVEFPTLSKIKAELLKISKNKDDYELNVQLYTRNKAERKELMREWKD
jgi:hypothetical protein